MTEQQHQCIFRCVPSGHRVHLVLDGGLPRSKSTDSGRLQCHPRHIDPDRKFPQYHGQFNELKLNIHEFNVYELDFHKVNL